MYMQPANGQNSETREDSRLLINLASNLYLRNVTDLCHLSFPYLSCIQYSCPPTVPKTIAIGRSWPLHNILVSKSKTDMFCGLYRGQAVVQRQRAGLQYSSSRVRTRPKTSDFLGRKKKFSTLLPSRGEVKPSVPCRSFTACRRSLNVTWKQAFRQNLPDISSPKFHLPPLGALAW